MIGKILVKFNKWYRVVLYKLRSNNFNIKGSYQPIQPVVFRGKGKIIFGGNVKLGVENSPFYHNTYAYIEPRTIDSEIIIGKNTHINNAISIVSEKRIVIGENVFMGYNCSIVDSNFHNLDPKKRNQTDLNPEAVKIGDNVFIGNDVSILKGVTLGKNVVVATKSVVTKTFPENVIIGGCPAKIIGKV